MQSAVAPLFAPRSKSSAPSRISSAPPKAAIAEGLHRCHHCSGITVGTDHGTPGHPETFGERATSSYMVLRTGSAGRTAAENYRQRTDSGPTQFLGSFCLAISVEFRHHFVPTGDAVACIEGRDGSSSSLASRKRLVECFFGGISGRNRSSKAFAVDFVGFAVRR